MSRTSLREHAQNWRGVGHAVHVRSQLSCNLETRIRAVIALFAILVLSAVPCLAQFPSETGRLLAAARLWVTVDYFHPSVVAGEARWDEALLSAIPAIRSAKDNTEFRSAISGMLESLKDPQTYLVAEGQPPIASKTEDKPQISVLQSAAGVSFLIRPMGGTEQAVIDVAGNQVVARLSQDFVPGQQNLRPAQLSAIAEDGAFPSAEKRLLAAIKTWGAIRYFFAYKDLMDEEWDDVFEAYLPKFIQAHDATEYNLTLSDLLTHLTDSNVTLHSKTMDDYFGVAPVGLRIRLLDKYPIVTEVLDPAATAAGVHPGDVVKRIGNESITDRFRRFVQYIPASTPQRSGYDTIQKITNGPDGSALALTIEDAKGEAHVVTLTRKRSPEMPQRTTEAVRILPGNVGYVDLDRLATEDVDGVMERLKSTEGIIFDLRGKATAARAVAAHLNADANAAVALVTTPIALKPDVATAGIATQTASTFVVQTLPAAKQPLYKGKIVALIDERTFGESEYAGLLFEAAAKARFVGVPSAGADSVVSELALPGGITVTYSSQDIRHGNGGKLQRLGLQPNVSAPTTTKGLRAGQDEALDAALALLVPAPGRQLAFYTQFNK